MSCFSILQFFTGSDFYPIRTLFWVPFVSAILEVKNDELECFASPWIRTGTCNKPFSSRLNNLDCCLQQRLLLPLILDSAKAMYYELTIWLLEEHHHISVLIKHICNERLMRFAEDRSIFFIRLDSNINPQCSASWWSSWNKWSFLEMRFDGVRAIKHVDIISLPPC